MSVQIAPQRNATGISMRDSIPSGYKKGSLQQFTPEQMSIFQNMYSNLGPDSFLSRLSRGDEGAFNQMEEPALRQFAGMQGNLASRFSGMGSGARRSSGFTNTMNQASSNFASDLASKRQEISQQAMRDLMNMSNQFLSQRPEEQFLVQKQQRQPWWQKFLGGALPAAGAAVGGYFGGVPGARIGASVGSAGAQAFQ